jgi:hypothetical protein
MEERRLSGGRLRSARYDVRTQRLEITFTDHSVRIWQGVPDEVWRRLLAAPNAGVYFDDRIADEYPNQPGSPAATADARRRLDDLFGGSSSS